MPKAKAIIIDDEKLARNIVKNYLKKRGDIELVGECSNGFEGIKSINEKKPDIIFLDIQMPKLNGFEMLELLDNIPIIIFTTAFDQYALKAFEVNATDYLLKPFNEDRFNETLRKALQQLSNKQKHVENINKLIKVQDDKSEFVERIVVKKGHHIIIIPIDELIYIEAQDDYVMIHSSKGNYLKQKTMKYFEDHLNPSDFIRVHRSYIISVKQINKIELFEKDSYQLELQNGNKIPVSKSGYAKLKGIL